MAAAEIEALAFEREDGLDDYLRALDGRITDLDEWIQRASESLLTFSIATGFRRNTMAAGKGPGATSTARSFFALHEYRRFLLEENEPASPPVDAKLRSCIRRWIFRMADEGTEPMSQESENGPNRFTFSHMLLALSFTEELASELGLGNNFQKVKPKLNREAKRLSSQIKLELEDPGILGLKPKDKAPHHFVTLHGVRAVDLSGLEIKDSGKIRTSVSATVLEQLGYHAAGAMARFDPGALVFGTALLGRFKGADREQLTEHAVSVAAKVQTDDGAWLSEQVVAANGISRIYVSSYEVGLGLSYLALRELAYGNVGLVRRILPCMEKVMELIRASYIAGEARTDGVKGWANDRSRWPGLIESWTTASVLSFMLRYRMVMQGVRQQLVLARYGVSIEKTKEVSWPDLDLAFPAHRNVVAKEAAREQIDRHLDRYTDPSEERKLTRALCDEVLAPVLHQPGNRPEKASLILYGPPGSRKTSLAKRAARALGWPILVLSPPNFLGEQGLDGFEGSAARIFNDLMRLRKVIVLFDECEDFFKPRRPKPRNNTAKTKGTQGMSKDEEEKQRQEERPEARTIGAFLTAGMLPRLQRLRDNRWVIFILATNIEELEELDEAVRRPGRFDFADEIGYPKLRAQQRYIEEHKRRKELGEKRARQFRAALEDFAKEDQKDKKAPREVPFAVIDYVIAGVLDDGWPGTRAQIANRLRDRMHEVDRPPSLGTAADYRSSSAVST